MKVIDFKNASCVSIAINVFVPVLSRRLRSEMLRQRLWMIMVSFAGTCRSLSAECQDLCQRFRQSQGIHRGEKKTVASLAPAYLGILDYEKPTGGRCPSKLGFSEVRETQGGSLCDRGLYKASGSRTDEEHHFHLLSKCQ